MPYFKEFLILALLSVVFVLTLSDVLFDYRAGASLLHLAVELGLVFTSFLLISVLGVGIWRQSRSNRRLRSELEALREQRDTEGSPELVAARHELSRVLHEQFGVWQLTETEREVAMLLLKGLSFREIAGIRNTLEKTVRQQASSIYRKSGVNGRHAFAAWFIEDYL
jgi:DNA-binding CsgD family transcriptional regulator